MCREHLQRSCVSRWLAVGLHRSTVKMQDVVLHQTRTLAADLRLVAPYARRWRAIVLRRRQGRHMVPERHVHRLPSMLSRQPTESSSGRWCPPRASVSDPGNFAQHGHAFTSAGGQADQNASIVSVHKQPVMQPPWHGRADVSPMHAPAKLFETQISAGGPNWAPWTGQHFVAARNDPMLSQSACLSAISRVQDIASIPPSIPSSEVLKTLPDSRSSMARWYPGDLVPRSAARLPPRHPAFLFQSS